MTKTLISTIGIVFISGCASTYVAPPSKPTAELYLVAENDSASTMLQGVSMWAFKDTECNTNEYGTRMGSITSNHSPAITPSHTVVANEPLVFTAMYIDARPAQNRQCAITGGFTPLPNKRYAARLTVTGDVSACSLGVYDVADGNHEPMPIDLKMPELVCQYGFGAKKLRNGQPLRTQWVVVPLILPH